MKKLFTIAVFALLGTCAFAQTSKGTIAVSGDLSLSFSDNDRKELNHSANRTYTNSTKNTAFGYAPGIGYFIKDNLRVGAFVGYGFNNNEYVSNNQPASDRIMTEDKEHTYKISASIIKYFMLSDKFAFTTAGGIGFDNQQRKSNNNPESSFQKDRETTGFYAGLTPGLVFFPSEKVSVGTGFGFLGFRSEKSTYYYNTYSQETSTANLGLDLKSSTWAVNIAYHFNR